MEEPRIPWWFSELVALVDGQEPAQACRFEVVAPAGDDAPRHVAEVRINAGRARAILSFTDPWGWRAPDEPEHHLLLRRDERGGWLVFETLPRWWTPLWFHRSGIGSGRDQAASVSSDLP